MASGSRGSAEVGQVPFDPAESARPDRLRLNGSLALGLVSRCARLSGPGPLDDELAACRQRLDDAVAATPEAMAQARAAASELAVRAAASLAVREGSRSVTADQHVQRLAREAMFLLVFGTRPGIKNELLRRLGAARPDSGCCCRRGSGADQAAAVGGDREERGIGRQPAEHGRDERFGLRHAAPYVRGDRFRARHPELAFEVMPGH